MEPLKHECGVAMIRLRKPLEYYKQKYGSYTYALDKLYLLMEKQHNRGQEAAGVGVVKQNAPAGQEIIYRERCLGKDAIPQIFGKIGKEIPQDVNSMDVAEVDAYTPYIGQVYMGHLKYSTNGKNGMVYAHPVLRRNNWRAQSLMLCGNFTLTNVDEMLEGVIASGQHPRIFSDTNMLLEQMGFVLDNEVHKLYRDHRDEIQGATLAGKIEDELDIANVLKRVSPEWDGAYVMCGVTGAGDMFTLRDPSGIRPAFYYYDDEVVVVASERPVIQTTFDVPFESVHELGFGEALIVNKAGELKFTQILEPKENARCSFERIYFSRGSDADIYKERKALGAALAKDILEMVDYDVDHMVVSFIPNTAEVAFFGMVEELEKLLERRKVEEIRLLEAKNELSNQHLEKILRRRIRQEKVAIKDVKMRTFITEGTSRDNMVAHVYDVTYGTIEAGVDTLVVIDDSIVRGTTLRQSILRQLERLHPKRIIVVSSSPQVRYPDYYGIDMTAFNQFVAFHAAIKLLRETGREEVIHETYRRCLAQRELPNDQRENCVKAIYAPFTELEVSDAITRLLTEESNYPIEAKVDILYQSLEGMHQAIPNHPGDWYFSGNYPTAGGNRLVNESYIEHYERFFK